MSRYPVSLVCPSCGSSRFKKFHDDHAATLRFLRECKDCGQRYEPRVPRWAAVCAIVVGILLAIGGVVSAFLFSGGFGQVAGVMIRHLALWCDGHRACRETTGEDRRRRRGQRAGRLSARKTAAALIPEEKTPRAGHLYYNSADSISTFAGDNMHRLIAIALLAASAFFGWPTQASAQAGGAKKPNIIFILADDLGYGDLGCYGQKKIKTPHLDKMAAQGLRFRQFYAGSTVCAPSRCALMTGLHTGHCRIRGNARVPLTPDDVTVARLLQQAGYTTALIGKWGLGEDGSTGIPRRQGFDYFFGYLNQHHAHNYYPDFLWRNEEKVLIKENVV